MFPTREYFSQSFLAKLLKCTFYEIDAQKKPVDFEA